MELVLELCGKSGFAEGSGCWRRRIAHAGFPLHDPCEKLTLVSRPDV